MGKMLRGSFLVALLLSATAALAAFSLSLARHRIFQVDEVQNVYMARTIGTHRWDEFATSAPLFLLGPLAAIARNGTASASILQNHRLVFLGLFWLNTGLIAAAAGATRPDRRGLTLFLLAATLAPLWDYGFEIRHDNLLEAGILAVWILGRRAGRIPGTMRYALIGAIPVLLQFCAFKAFLYFAPICGLFLVIPNPDLGVKRARAWAASAMGASTAFLAAWGAHTAAGTWNVYLRGFHGSVGVARDTASFSSWPALGRLLPQAPLLVAGIVLAGFLAARQAFTTGTRPSFWTSSIPEALLFLSALAVFFLNPTPFPYNLVLLVPQALLAVVAAAPLLAPLTARIPAPLLVFVFLGLAMGHLAPFLSSTLRHLAYRNDRQLKLAAAAEALTAPVGDRVYDGSGLVVTRDSIGYELYLHSLNMAKFRDGTYPSVRSMLESRPASVLLPNYRMSWLPDADQLFIRDHYLPIAGDFLVLGAEISATGSWRCLKAGRYRVLVAPLVVGVAARVDGVMAPTSPLRFEAGEHRFEIPTGSRLRVVWVGPTLDRPPDLGPGSWQETFINFY